MLGIVLVAHAPLAESMRTVAEHVVGSLPDVQTVDVTEGIDIEKIRQEIADKVIQANEGEGVVIATDILGGVPSNLALSLKSDTVRVISGLNVPMLVKLLRLRNKDLDTAVSEAMEAGAQFILDSGKGA